MSVDALREGDGTARWGRRSPAASAQLWIESISDDPEAVSALDVARRTLPVGATIRRLRRARLIELRGALPPGPDLLERVHRSTQFFNPHKERCRLRAAASDPTPIAEDEWAVLVFERGGERRPAAERWWRHDGGGALTVREGVAWLVALAPGADPERTIEDLVVARDRRHGLLCNPHSQEYRPLRREAPLECFGRGRTPSTPRRRAP